MRTIIQRCKTAQVTVVTNTISKIQKGLMILVGIGKNDTAADAEFIANKILNLRLWEKDGKPWNASVMDMQYELLIVSQFTLYTVLKGNRPDFHSAMAPAEGKVAYNAFVDRIKRKYDASKIQEGEYGAYMEVQLVNDGPVTITLDSEVDTDLSRVKAKEQKASDRIKSKNNKVAATSNEVVGLKE